jgi:phage baseplate assembly protein W
MEIKSISLKNPNGLPISKGNEVLLERVGRIIMTSPFERVNNPMFGSLLFNEFLFELENILMQNVEYHLRTVIERYEPRVLVSNIDIEVNKDIANIKVEMVTREDFEPLTFEASVGI